MPPRRRAPKRRLRKRKGNRRGRIGAGVRKQLKQYKFEYKLAPQVVYSSQTTAASLIVSTAPNTGLLPVTSSNLSVIPSGTLGVANYVDFGIGQSFQLTDCANFGALANRFDAYKIDRITMELQYLNNVSYINGGGAMPTFWFAWDQDDATIPQTVGTLTGIQGVRKWQPTANKTTFKYSFKPTNLVNLRTSTVGVAGTTQLIMPKGFINCGSPTATHMGLKMFVTDWYAPGVLPTLNAFRINWTYHVTYRSPIDCR